ncbi:MAG: AMP-binding protein, partial [Paracoccaceae bacterium]
MKHDPLFAEMFWAVVNDPAKSGNLAISTQEKSITYSELGELVAARAQEFLANVPPTGRIALLQGRTVELCVDILAGLCSGVSVSILSKTDAVDLSFSKLGVVGAHQIVTDPACYVLAQQIAAKPGCEVSLRSDPLGRAMPTEQPPIPDATAEALVIFTSGSTSTPKGVALSQLNIAINTHSLSKVIPVTPADHLLQVMPFYHTNGLLNQILLPLAMGARVTLLSHFEPQSFLDALTEAQPTYFTAVPTMLTRLLEHNIPKAGVENLRFIRSGAAPLLPDAQRRIEAHFGCDVVVSYGQTETTCTNTANPPDARKIGSVGQALEGREIAILAPDTDAPVGAGQPGEVCFRGPCIAMGYVGEPSFDTSQWLRTGDYGYLDDDGFLFLTGRLKDIIIRGGANLSPRQIEDCLLGDESVDAVAVFGMPDADLGEVPVACIVPSGRPLKLSDLNDRIARTLSPAHRLNGIYEYQQLPLNDIGKVEMPRLKQEVIALEKRHRASGMSVRCEDDAPLEYIKRTRNYYTALGFGTPYEWAQNDDIPFCTLKPALNEATVAIVTTAAPFQPGAGDQGPGAPYNAGAKFYKVYSGSTSEMPDLRISHVGIDRENTRADDISAYFPLESLKAAAAAGRIGRVAPNFFGFPTNRSKRVTETIDAPELLKRCQTDQVDAVILVPNCPVCHQCVTMAARVLESAGIPT